MRNLHEAFADPDVQAVIPVMGGSSANQLLKYIDYDLIKKHPKIFCGLSDITELSNAIYWKTGLITYYGPHFTMLGASQIVDHAIDSIRKTFFSDEVVSLHPSEYYSNSEWDKEVIVNNGFWTINAGHVEAKVVGGNIRTFTLMLGSEYMPDIADTILLVEDNKIVDFRGVQKELQSVLNQPHGDRIKGLIIGRFQRQTGMTRELLTKMINSKKELEGVPVIGNVDLGHTAPILTFPIGGTVRFNAKANDEIKLEVVKH